MTRVPFLVPKFVVVLVNGWDLEEIRHHISRDSVRGRKRNTPTTSDLYCIRTNLILPYVPSVSLTPTVPRQYYTSPLPVTYIQRWSRDCPWLRDRTLTARTVLTQCLGLFDCMRKQKNGQNMVWTCAQINVNGTRRSSIGTVNQRGRRGVSRKD